MRIIAVALTLAVVASCRVAQVAQVAPLATNTRTQNVILVVTDGLRWQDLFNGADSLLMFGDPRVLGGDTAAMRARFWRPTPAARREAMMPFMWGTIAREGQIFGNRALGSTADVTNGLKFSYPGYNELLSGFVDPQIASNEFGPNPNVTVFEWLNNQPSLRGRVAAMATWDAFADIFNRDRAKLFVHAGWEPPFAAPRSASDSLLNALYATTIRLWGNNAYDSFTQAVAMRVFRTDRPRVAFIGYGETDEWAHAGRYDRLLTSARTVDDYLRELWTFAQSHPDYRGRTTLIVTTDHGRGRTVSDWTNHGRSVDGAEEMWIAVLGPDTPARGERRNSSPVTQAQIAATVAALLGLDYRRDQPRAAAPIADVLR
jgi:hypothetical protein